MKVNFQALGCRLNEAELESWSSEIVGKGHQLTANSDDADVIVFNTCSVTAEADRKSRKLINRLHKSNPQVRLVVTGCYASLQEQKVRTQLGVDLVIGNQHKEGLVDTILNEFQLPATAGGVHAQHALFDRGRQRAFIKIQDGCRYRCTFCIVTVARGEERSRERQHIIDEINRHHQRGVQEVVLTGVHVGGYGSDTGDNLYALLSEILDKTAVPRIRLASVEPWDLPDNFFSLFSDPRLMPHMHLPLQSGSDGVLRRMARRCKTAEFSRIVDKARSAVPFFNVTTDIITGFPGETEQEWQQTLKYVQETGFGHIHIFTYSSREGTKAASLAGQLEISVKKERSAQLHQLADRLQHDAMSTLIGQHCEVLWEHRLENSADSWIGYTPQYHRVVAAQADLEQSQISAIRIAQIDEHNNCLLGHSV